jgi:hypothetical protein
MYAASVENDALGSHVVTLAVEATFKMRGAGVGGTGVGGTAVGGVVGLGGAGVGAVVGGTGVAGGVHAATSMTKMVNTDSSLRYLISPSPFQSELIRAEKVKSPFVFSFEPHLLPDLVPDNRNHPFAGYCILPPSVCKILTGYRVHVKISWCKTNLHAPKHGHFHVQIGRFLRFVGEFYTCW